MDSLIERLFDTLDVHTVLDRVLGFFATRVECRNVYWLKWRRLDHYSTIDESTFCLELEGSIYRDPGLRAYEDLQVGTGQSAQIYKLLRHFFSLTAREKLRLNEPFVCTESGSVHLAVPIFHPLGHEGLGVLIFEGLDADEPLAIAQNVQESARLMARFVDFAYQYWEACNLSFIDDLTGLYNHRYLKQLLENEIQRAKRQNSKFTVLFLDIDYFKMVNDTKGHWIGSKALKEIGQLIKKSVRSCDVAFRYGGDEFLVLLVNTGLEHGKGVAERIRKVVETTPLLIDGHQLNLTASIGLATYPDHASSTDVLVQMADQAMYYGKNKSRNVVYVAS